MGQESKQVAAGLLPCSTAAPGAVNFRECGFSHVKKLPSSFQRQESQADKGQYKRGGASRPTVESVHPSGATTLENQLLAVPLIRSSNWNVSAGSGVKLSKVIYTVPIDIDRKFDFRLEFTGKQQENQRKQGVRVWRLILVHSVEPCAAHYN